MRLSLVLFFIIALTQAYTTFDTTCTKPSTAVNFVSSADVRGTIDILWSCLFVILACTWTVQHLNLPEQREDQDPGWLGDIKWSLKRSWTTTRLALTTVIAPEIVIGKCWADLKTAQVNLKEFRAIAAVDEVPWTITHVLFANMGGFVLRTHVPKRVGTRMEVKIQTDPHIAQQDDTDQGQLRMGNQDSLDPTLNALKPVSLDEGKVSDLPEGTASTGTTLNHPNPYHLNARDILNLRKAKILPRLPYISLEELQHRTKSDSLIRVIAIVQIIWVIIQIIVRGVRKLAISQLEIAVVAFASCAVAIYGLNWYKPKGVQVPITILQYRNEAPKTALDEVATDCTGAMLSGVFRSALGRPDRDKGTPISNDVCDTNGANTNFLGLAFGSLVFGGIHLAAWNFKFPTTIELLLWRSASLWCTCFMFIFGLAVIVVIGYVDKYTDADTVADAERGDKHLNRIFGGLLALYGVARLFLLVEVFRTLCFLPPDAYVATWASNVPHIA